MQDFKKLKVWEKSHQLTLNIYKATENFPREELFGLKSQMRRSSASIPTNLAEGTGRGSNTDFARFVQISFGSANELEYQLLLANDLHLITDTDYTQLVRDVIEIKKMLTGLLGKLRG